MGKPLPGIYCFSAGQVGPSHTVEAPCTRRNSDAGSAPSEMAEDEGLYVALVNAPGTVVDSEDDPQAR